jgi:hypothetical protein
MVEARTYDEAASVVEALRSPVWDDLAERLEELAGAVSVGFPGTAEEYEKMREDLFDLARLARASAPSEARVDPEDVERAERWIGDKIHRYYDKGYDEEDDRDVVALRSVMDSARASAALPTSKED